MMDAQRRRELRLPEPKMSLNEAKYKALEWFGEYGTAWRTRYVRAGRWAFDYRIGRFINGKFEMFGRSVRSFEMAFRLYEDEQEQIRRETANNQQPSVFMNQVEGILKFREQPIIRVHRIQVAGQIREIRRSA